MIEEGCLEGVDEVYGFHNWPTYPIGYCLVKPGPMMSEMTIITLTINGKGGHGKNSVLLLITQHYIWKLEPKKKIIDYYF